MTTAKRTQPNVLELDVALAAVVVVVVVGWDVVVVACGRVVVVAGRVVVVVGAVVGGTVVVVVGATVVVVTGALVVVVSWAAAVPDRTPSRTGVAAIARNSAVVRRETFGCISPAYGHGPARSGDHGRSCSRFLRLNHAQTHETPTEDHMQLDIHVPRFTWPGGPEAIGPTFASLARTAEAIGVRTLSVMDHWFQMEMLWPAEEPMLEGYTALSFAAAKTERLRFRLLVGGVTYRHPGLLAKTITTLDVLSGGRAELGLGAAWYEREHLGLGVPFPPLRERYERLEETLQICFQMWSDDNGPYEGLHYQLAETLCSPQPVSSPRPRVLIGGGGERKTLRLVAIYADACNIIGDVETVTHKVGVLQRHCDDVGRDFAQIEVTALIGVADDAGPDTILREAQALHDAGVHAIVIRAAGPEPTQWLEETWGPVLPSLAALG
jgi:F420-dependent oxidoreductase-like protein